MDDLINVPNVQEDISDDDLINDSQQPEVVSTDDDLINVPNEETSSQDDLITEESNNLLEQPEPLVIETKGKWQPFEVMADPQFEEGKTYKIQVQGQCEFMISKDKPTFGFGSNEIVYTKDNVNRLWIKTGG